MDNRTFYLMTGGDYEGTLTRLMKDERITRFLRKFGDSNELAEMKAALAASDYQGAFLHVHNLKGTSANMGLTALYEASSRLCEELRQGVKPEIDITEMTEQVEAEYHRIMELIVELD